MDSNGAMKKIKPVTQWRASGGAPLGWEVRESFTKEVAFEQRLNFKNKPTRTSVVVQWLRLCLPMQKRVRV